MAQSDNVWLRIVNSASLARARDHLLDAVFVPDTIRFDEVKQVCCLELLLPASDLSRYERIAPFLTWRITPFRRWDLVLHAVSGYDVTHFGKPLREGIYSVASLDFDMEEGFSIVTHEAMIVRFATSRIDGELAETDQVDFDKPLRSLSVRLCKRQVADNDPGG